MIAKFRQRQRRENGPLIQAVKLSLGTVITCSKCGLSAQQYRARSLWCHACWSEYLRNYNAKNSDRIRSEKRKTYDAARLDAGFVENNRKRLREYWRNLRHEVMMAYGGYTCACCGETEPQFLTIDHIFNDGAKHRREIMVNAKGNGKGASSRTLKWLKDNGFPRGFQVLCMNCNLGKQRNGGVCPHKTNYLLCAA